jgi:hypothetical protein
VLELEPQVRAELGLAGQPALYPSGRPARPAGLELADLVEPTQVGADDPFAFCSV